MQFVKPKPFTEAVKKLGAKTVITSGLDSEAWSKVPVALRERAFFSSRVESARFLQRARDGVADYLTSAQETLESGETALKTGSRADFIKQLQDFALAEGLGPLDPKEQGTIKDITSERRLGLIFDVQTRQANDFGYWQQGMDPDVLNAFPAMRFIREKEVKEPRDFHHLHEGEVHLKSELGFWTTLNKDFGVPWGPWGWGCGHATEDVDRTEAEHLNLLKPGQKVDPPEVGLNDHLQASVKELDPDLTQQLKSAFGKQITVKDDAIYWKGQKPKQNASTPHPQEDRAQPSAFPTSISSLEPVRDLGGSTGAQLVRDPETKALFVLKRGSSAAHLREEFAADQLYQSLGIPVPEAKLYEGSRPTKLARFIEGTPLKQALQKASAEEKTALLSRLQDHFAADALLGNWDVAGLDLDNIIVDKSGVPWRIDNGGALRFRAQGAKKTDFDAFPMEPWTLRDPAQNAQTAKLFGGLDAYSLARQVQGIDSARFMAAAPEELKPILQARLANLHQISAKALEYERSKFLAPHADEITKHMMGLRKADAFNGMAAELKQGHPGDVRPVDSEGNAFDLLRTPKGKVKADPSETFYQDILEAAKTINHHHAQGDLNYNTAKIVKALGWKTVLQGESEMGAHYLKSLHQIEAAQGNLKAKVETVVKFQSAIPVQNKATSVVSRLVNYVQANGGDWSIIEKWAQQQAGSTTSSDSLAVQYWLSRKLSLPADAFHGLPGEAGFKSMVAQHGPKFEKSFEMFHAFIQEVLGRVGFTGNDQKARLLRVLRTETEGSAIPIKKGQSGDYKRRVNASGSIFAPVFSGTRTVTTVPHSRVTGLYFLERHPGSGTTFFLGDSENEVTYIAQGYKAKNLGRQGDVNLSPGTDSTQWEV
jgi:hypothetical protein